MGIMWWGNTSLGDSSSRIQELLETQLFEIAGKTINGATILLVVVILVATFVLSRVVQHAITHAFRLSKDPREGSVRAVGRLAHYAVLLTGSGIALETIGIDLRALFAAGAIFAVGLGFAMQSIAQNFVSGVILLVERSIKPGDILELNDELVRVLELGIRATIVETRDGENMIVPNSTLIQSTVKNFTLGDSDLRVRVAVGVAYSSDMELVSKVLTEVVEKANEAWAPKKKRAPFALMTDFGDNAVHFEVGAWTPDPWNSRFSGAELRQAVWRAFQTHNITIAFPQLDLHLDEQSLKALRRDPAGQRESR